MKQYFFISLFIIGLVTTMQAQEDYKFGIGLRLSNATPTLSNSVSAKYFLQQDKAIEGLLSFGGSRFGIGALYQIHKPFTDVAGLKWFYGFGGYLGFQDGNTYLGPTGAVGLDYKFNAIPLNLSLDWKPELDILPAVNFIPDAFGLTARFTIK
jgi:hypothetical protein